jgi:hypothetical protein
LEHYLHLLILLLTAALLMRLRHEGLHRVYPAFFNWLLFELASSVVMYAIPVRTKAVSWGLTYLVLRELCLMVFRQHPGIEAAVRIGIWISLGLALAIPAGILLLARFQGGTAYPQLKAFFLVYQSAMFFLTILFAGAVLFVAWFPVRLRRNLVVYCFGFSLKFIAETALLLLHNFSPSLTFQSIASDMNLAAAIAVMIGEPPFVSVAQQWHPARSQALMERLEKLNQTLEEALRKRRP